MESTVLYFSGSFGLGQPREQPELTQTVLLYYICTSAMMLYSSFGQAFIYIESAESGAIYSTPTQLSSCALTNYIILKTNLINRASYRIS